MNRFKNCTVNIYLDGYNIDEELETARDTITAIDDLVARHEGRKGLEEELDQTLAELEAEATVSDFAGMTPPQHAMGTCRDTMPGAIEIEETVSVEAAKLFDRLSLDPNWKKRSAEATRVITARVLQTDIDKALERITELAREYLTDIEPVRSGHLRSDLFFDGIQDAIAEFDDFWGARWIGAERKG